MVHECENNPPVFETGEWKTWALPGDPEKARCFRYANKDGQCNKESFSNQLQECNNWLYEDYNSIVAEVILEILFIAIKIISCSADACFIETISCNPDIAFN